MSEKERVPEGNYPARCAGTERAVLDSGLKILDMKFKVSSGTQEGRMLYRRFFLDGDGVDWAEACLRACGWTGVSVLSDRDLGSLNKEVNASVKIDRKNTQYNRVSIYARDSVSDGFFDDADPDTTPGKNDDPDLGFEDPPQHPTSMHEDELPF